MYPSREKDRGVLISFKTDLPCAGPANSSGDSERQCQTESSWVSDCPGAGCEFSVTHLTGKGEITGSKHANHSTLGPAVFSQDSSTRCFGACSTISLWISFTWMNSAKWEPSLELELNI